MFGGSQMDENHYFFFPFFLPSFVSLTGTNVTGIKRMLYTYGDARVVTQLGEGDVQVIQLAISKKSRLINSPATIKKAVIATIYRKGDLIIPTARTILAEGDVLLVAVKSRDLSEVVELIKGE